ncbi:tetratricopeptide repeat protein [Aurantimonas sp. HBX-1]|uniref:tetratricopeptide repeat protein n=1 Tax=Aurantimonas sp. HBX-1 TaxID=2906072 RepID=UPI001F33D4F2|nr:tetratricopeptide repeat protein [Aurantimonas sp. HBX-1]UIJ70875.1 sel1 repeat family protein [Aurantimonas sp. HBX-1]
MRRRLLRTLLPPLFGGMVVALAVIPAAAQAEDDGKVTIDEMLRGSQGDDLPTPSAAPERDAPKTDAPARADLAYGAFQRGFYLSALKIAEPLANLGDPAAQTLLGEIYSRGLGVPQDLQAAAKWYEAAAGSGSAEGQFRYAMMLLDGTAGKEDLAQARDLMKAAADKGLPLAQYNYAQMLIEAAPNAGFEEATPLFEKAANAGVPDAQYAMAQIYAYGRGVTADVARARAWLRAAAINGQDIAQIEYGIWLINGKGGEALPEEGFRFLKRAAERGNPIAVNRVAHLYKDGIGTAPDTVEAAKWAVLAKRLSNTDPVLDDFFRGLDAAAQKSALEAANRIGSG